MKQRVEERSVVAARRQSEGGRLGNLKTERYRDLTEGKVLFGCYKLQSSLISHYSFKCLSCSSHAKMLIRLLAS